MSFVLEFRKSYFLGRREETRARAVESLRAAVAPKPARKPKTGTGHAIRHSALMLAAAMALMAVFNSSGALSYANSLNPNAVTDRVVALAERWHRAMDAARATRVEETIRAGVERMRDAGWGDVAHPFAGTVQVGGETPGDEEPY